ncbi:MAG: SUMF1/EgtB/PvdO family nonheme iron enzyme [Planctomycetota bacterium]|jgi:formylglycine-generating enzyme required for sulfatase activity
MRSIASACLRGCIVAVFAGGGAGGRAAEPPVAALTIRADWYDRGNVRVSLPPEAYADKYACIWNAGALPNQSEYDVEFPVTAEYTFVALYTAASSRPVEIHIDGEKVHTGFASVTGSWQTSSAKWETQCTLRITRGKHTIKLLCPGPCMPHICAFRLESPVRFPDGWKLDRPAARRQIQTEPLQSPKGHLIPEVPLLAELDAGLEVEVIRAEQYDFVGSSATNELLMDCQPMGVSTLQTPWVARLALADDDGSVRQAALNLSPSRLREMLRRTEAMVGEFRTMDGAGRQLLGSERDRCARLLLELDALLERPEEKAKWDRFLELYLEVFRLERRVALGNPLLSFDRLLLVKRSVDSPRLGLPQNWQSNCVLPAAGFDDEIAVLSPVHAAAELSTLYRPEGPYFVGDVDLHFDADKLLFSSIGEHAKWHVFEINADGTGLRQVTPSLPDVHNYDACYLPDGGIIFCSTASMAGVPCVNGSTRVANFYRIDPDATIRQLCFDQEHNWCPTVFEDGRVLYLRWEYTDTPHSHDRVLFSMNPDGTEQMEFYGGNSYWPNSLFYARPIPGRPSMFVGIVGGHHGVPRMGELVLFDAALGRRESSGAVQRIPGHGVRVESTTDPRYESSLIVDNLVDGSWPKFLHPYPLSEKYFLVACQPAPQSLWGIYLADVFDNLLLIKEVPGYALLEPVPLRATARPPVIPPKVDLDRRDAVVHLSNVYAGDGLKGVPRGAVKRLRLISYHYLFPGMGGPQGVVGMEGPWDIKRIVGTVPVEEDGSAVFRIPANTPIAVQPLDAEGKALQLMRSWFTGMPGEVLSCVGCHESQSSTPPARSSLAGGRAPAEIEPWHGPARGFNFEREVQPVLDKYCVGCHDGQPVFDLRGLEQITDYTSVYHYGGDDAGHFSTSYVALHRFVRRPGLESDYHMLMPMEFHADTTQLVQMLAKGHYNVQLDAEAWDRLITWIDLNAPYHGTWTEIAGADRVEPLARRRRELLKRYARVDSDPESEAYPGPRPKIDPVTPEPAPRRGPARVDCPGWPFDAEEARSRQKGFGPHERTVTLADGVTMELVLIPPGEFVMGSTEGHLDEQPLARVRIDEPFWMGRLEVANRQFRLFDPTHDSRVESRFAMQFGVRGFYVNRPEQPVVRVSWQGATAFCRWLSRRTGERFRLPTEAQWEYACRAGTDTPLYYGDEDTDFSPFANLADATLSEFVCHPYKKHREPFANPSKYDDWIPKDTRFDDGGFVSEKGGAYQPNAWGLCDMHGNVAEWTRSAFRPYPYRADDGRDGPSAADARVVRGGSWRDRPTRCRSAFRLAYRPYQAVYNVGFRVICEVGGGGAAAATDRGDDGG